MIPYIILSLILASVVACEVISKRGRYTFISEKKTLFIVFFLLFSCASFRDLSVGADFARYEDHFINFGGYGLSSSRLELAWYPIYTFFYEIANFRVYVFFFYFTLYYFLLRFIWKNSLYPLLAVLLYVLLGHYFESYNIMRQSFAALFVMYSAIYIEKRDLIRFTGLILIGGLFHLSTLLFLPLYFVAHWVRNYKTVLIMFLIGTLVIGYLQREIFQHLLVRVFFIPQYARYAVMTRDNISFLGWFVIAANSAIAIVSLIIVNDVKVNCYMALYVIGSCLNNLFYQYEYLFRFYRPLLLFFMIFALPNLISDIKKRSLRTAYTILIIFYGFCVFYAMLKNNDNGIVPYELFFS